MRKLLAAVLVFVAAFAFGIGIAAPQSAQAGNCYFTCDCAGNPLYCCVNDSGVESCKPTSFWQCPQVYEC